MTTDTDKQLKEKIAEMVKGWFGEPVIAVEDQLFELYQQVQREERVRIKEIIKEQAHEYTEEERMLMNPDNEISAVIHNRKLENLLEEIDKPKSPDSQSTTTSDLLPFKHGEEGTHFACIEMSKKFGSKVRCCGCTNHDCDTKKEVK